VSLSSIEIVDTIEQAFQATGVPREKITVVVTETQQISRREEAETGSTSYNLA
jgi:EAL domain-containing protein (putative c-di-GMP-specific phosphodiesterase class I)